MIVMNNNHKNKGRVMFKFITDDSGQERMVRKEPFKVPVKQPVIGHIEFKNGTGENVRRQSVAIHVQEKNGTLVLKVTGVKEKTKRFIIPRENLFSLVVTQDNKQFRKHLEIRKGRLRDLKKGANHA